MSRNAGGRAIHAHLEARYGHPLRRYKKRILEHLIEMDLVYVSHAMRRSSLLGLARRRRQKLRGGAMWRAILTDSHFWVPAAVLLFGIALLVYLR